MKTSLVVCGVLLLACCINASEIHDAARAGLFRFVFLTSGLLKAILISLII